MTTKQTSTHVMVPPDLKDRLKALSRCSRVPQSEYLRAATDLALRRGQSLVSKAAPKEDATAQLVSIVYRLEPEALEGLRTLAAETRIRQGEYMRLALESVVSTHEAARKVGAA